jgi:hypothetical protein
MNWESPVNAGVIASPDVSQAARFASVLQSAAAENGKPFAVANWHQMVNDCTWLPGYILDPLILRASAV